MGITTLVIRLIIIVHVTIITFTIAQPTIIRCCHGSTIANNKLYVGGGATGPVGNGIFTDDFFSLDLTVPFSTSSPFNMPYEEHAKVPVKDDPKGSAIYGYSLELNAWSEITPNGAKMPVESTTKISGVTDSSLNTIYIFDNSIMYVFDVLNNFFVISANLAPYQVNYYAAVMLNTGEIAYICGGNDKNNIPMEQILLFNTKLSSWYIKNAQVANGVIPSPRKGHTASIAPDGRIFVYGGYDGSATGSSPTFAVLEYINGEFAWSTPQLFNQSYPFRIYHTSHVFDNYLIIAFGRNLTDNRLNTIDMIDISNRDNYKVVTNFVPPGYVPPAPSPSPPPPPPPRPPPTPSPSPSPTPSPTPSPSPSPSPTPSPSPSPTPTPSPSPSPSPSSKRYRYRDDIPSNPGVERIERI
ncbi:hypothetical protein RhiirC2_778576 [Rhizophagus irregularis]|uniref:Galactose oxidase n=1 Tax=Rhizophagus irregularis TaxID=588596 RepID=A0A2N1NBU5_9GLOM|nr:hypothetical protein RhiirC2_778576 [Rhizophagus irregularis]